MCDQFGSVAEGLGVRRWHVAGGDAAVGDRGQ